MLGIFLDILVQERVNLVGLGLLSLKGPAYRVVPWLASGKFGFEMSPLVPSGKVIWCANGTEFHCASLPRLFFFNHVIYGERLLSFWEFLMIVADHDGASVTNLWKSLNFESQGILLGENTTHVFLHFTTGERWELRDLFFQTPPDVSFLLTSFISWVSSFVFSQLSQQCHLQRIILYAFFFFLRSLSHLFLSYYIDQIFQNNAE